MSRYQNNPYYGGRYGEGGRDHGRYQNNNNNNRRGDDERGSGWNERGGRWEDHRGHYGDRNTRGYHGRHNDTGNNSRDNNQSYDHGNSFNYNRSNEHQERKRKYYKSEESTSDHPDGHILSLNVESKEITPLTPEQEEFKKILKDQYRFPEAVEMLPPEAFFPDSSGWIKKKKRAAEKAVDAVRKEYDKLNDQEAESDIESDPEDCMTPQPHTGGNHDKFAGELNRVKAFMDKIPTCYPFTTGFDIIVFTTDRDKACYCPCSGFFQKWRKQVGLDKVVDQVCDFQTAVLPIQLMAHLKDVGGMKEEKKEMKPMSCPFHYALRVYLEDLYSDFRGGVGHKALYQINDGNYRKAAAAEMAMLQREILAGRKVIAEHVEKMKQMEIRDKERENKMKQLEKINSGMYAKITALNEDRKAFGIEKKEQASKLTYDQLNRHSKQWEMMIRGTKSGYAKKDKLKVTVDGSWGKSMACDIQEVLSRALHSNKKTHIRGALFEKCASRPEHILLDWDVVFENKLLIGQAKRDLTAKDEGGPSRQFMTECWKQLSGLQVPILKKGAVRLFEDSPSGVVPLTDEKLKSEVKEILKRKSECKPHEFPEPEVENFIEDAKMLYFAVGRIILHSMMSGITVASPAMIPLYQNFLLRGCQPGDSDYDKDDILKHIDGGIIFSNAEKALSALIGEEYDTTNGSKVILDKETIFTELVPDQCINSRRIALDALSNGLTLKNSDNEVIFDPKDFFGAMPLEVAQKLLFSRPTLTAEDVIGALVPKFDEGVEQWDGDPADRLDHKREQELFYEQTFKPFLRKKGENEKEDDVGSSFLTRFVECCTGLNYLPFVDGKPGNAITVEFNYTEPEPGAHPKFWTCNNVIVFPGYLYDGNNEVFEEKMEQAIELSYGQFDMN